MKLSKNSAWMLAIAFVAVLTGWYFMGSSTTAAKIVTAKVTEGPIVRSVTATGTVNPVITVQVGTYVSGPITAIYADYNAPVKKGQSIAKIDPRPYQVTVDIAHATLANSRAQLGKDTADLDYKKVTYERNLALYKADAVSRTWWIRHTARGRWMWRRSGSTGPISSSRPPTSRPPKSISITPISCRRWTALSSPATLTSARPWPRAFRLRRYS